VIYKKSFYWGDGMLTARTAIENRIQEIKEERRALLDEYQELIQALREMDAAAPQDVPQAVVEQMKECLSVLREVVPPLQVSSVIEYLAQHNGKEVAVTAEKPQPMAKPIQVRDTPAFKQAVQEAKAAEAKKAIRKTKREGATKGKKQKEFVQSLVIKYLSENPEAQSAKHIREYVEKKGFPYTDAGLRNILNELKDSNRIIQPAYGKYQLVDQNVPLQQDIFSLKT